jgi:hypothetical protein
MIINRRSVPSPVIITAMVARLVLFLHVRIWMVFLPTNSNLFFCAHQKIDQRLIHVEDEMPVLMRAE